MNNTTLSPGDEAIALSNVPVLELGEAFAKASPEGQAKFREILRPTLQNLSSVIKTYQGAEQVYIDIMFPLIEVSAEEIAA